ncbi:ROK family protein [Echinicola arenosa]|nr:ROK family protein [Echinicola arenosa]
MSIMNENYAIGVDVGGSHITVGKVNLLNGNLVHDRLIRKEVNSKGSTEEIIKAWAQAIKEIAGDGLPTCKIGIAMPGPFDYQDGISWIDSTQDKYEALYGKNVKELLAEEMGIMAAQIRFKNDAACFLQGEVFGGAAKGEKRAIGITLGTGVGTAYFHGKEAEDAARWGDEFGESIVEEYFSTRWFARKYLEKTGLNLNGVKQLVEMKSNDWVNDIFDEFSTNFSKFLERFISEEKPEIVILGGSISQSSDMFLPKVEALIFESFKNVKIAITELGEQSALIGAASCWYKEGVDVRAQN